MVSLREATFLVVMFFSLSSSRAKFNFGIRGLGFFLTFNFTFSLFLLASILSSLPWLWQFSLHPSLLKEISITKYVYLTQSKNIIPNPKICTNWNLPIPIWWINSFPTLLVLVGFQLSPSTVFTEPSYHFVCFQWLLILD